MTGFLITAFAAFLVLAYFRAPAWLWTAGAALFLAWLSLRFDSSTAARIALAAGIITAREQAQLQRTARLRDEVIRIDDFPQDFGRAELALPPAHKAAA